jgi:alginate O-acetyltransferase complex protein AlgI
MLFTDPAFWLFLIVVLALFYAAPRPLGRYILLAASLYFYMCWNARFVVFLLSLITVDYAAALWIDSRSGWQRRSALLLSLAANLGFLAYFKYTNFLITTFTQLVRPGAHPHLLNVILPLGISFHTFQSISYVVDVYRRQQRPVRSFVDYALFVAFFPQLVAGPIVRARDFFANLWQWNRPAHEDVQRAASLIVTGLAKKLVCADRFALVADRYFADPAGFPGMVPAWTGTVAFAFQIFFDFSGYTDIAIGSALLFGFHFPENFRRPYLACGISDFWRRWHISLSTWLRDYLYIPMGGNRGGAWRTYRNLLATMVLGGLWHGASWTFVIWGAYHGMLLSLERLVLGKREYPGTLRLPVTVLTFGLVAIGWVFFRAGNLYPALFICRQMLTGHGGRSLLTIWHWRLAALTLAIALLKEYRPRFPHLRASPWLRAAAIVCGLLAIELFGLIGDKRPFVYFQF